MSFSGIIRVVRARYYCSYKGNSIEYDGLEKKGKK